MLHQSENGMKFSTLVDLVKDTIEKPYPESIDSTKERTEDMSTMKC